MFQHRFQKRINMDHLRERQSVERVFVVSVFISSQAKLISETKVKKH